MTSCNHSSLHPKSVFTIDTLLLMFEHNYIYTQYYFPFVLFGGGAGGGGKVKGINRRGGGALFCDFVSTKWSASILILIETILKDKNLQPLGANSYL